jgi:hypothetical protein
MFCNKTALFGEMRKTGWFYRFTNLYPLVATGDLVEQRAVVEREADVGRETRKA